jgi:hypothetical protein
MRDATWRTCHHVGTTTCIHAARATLRRECTGFPSARCAACLHRIPCRRGYHAAWDTARAPASHRRGKPPPRSTRASHPGIAHRDDAIRGRALRTTTRRCNASLQRVAATPRRCSASLQRVATTQQVVPRCEAQCCVATRVVPCGRARRRCHGCRDTGGKARVARCDVRELIARPVSPQHSLTGYSRRHGIGGGALRPACACR